MGEGAARDGGHRDAVTAVVLAAGRGTRMREATTDVILDANQAAMADRGLKILIPFHGRPFLAWCLDTIVAAGMERACIVVGRDRDVIERSLAGHTPPALSVDFVEQRQPRGSADALLAAESCVGRDPCIVVNSDNVYPSEDLARLRSLEGPGLIGYTRGGLVRGGLPEARLRAFAVLDVAGDGTLRAILEKPDADAVARLGPDAPISMTCWRFDPHIFDACRSITPSHRGELELPDAVTRLLDDGVRFAVLPSDRPVLDLTRRDDVPLLAAHLARRRGD